MWFLKRRCRNGRDNVDQDDGDDGGDRAQPWKRTPGNERREIWMRRKRHDYMMIVIPCS